MDTGTTDADFVLLGRESATPRETLKPGNSAPQIGPVTWLNGGGIPSLKALRGRLSSFSSARHITPPWRRPRGSWRRSRASTAVASAVVALYDASLPAKELAAYARARNLRYPVGVVAPSPGLGWDSPVFRRYSVHACQAAS